MLNAASDLPEDPALLKAMIAQLQAQNTKLTTTLRAHDLVVQALRLQIAKLRKQAFGKSSEKIEREKAVAQVERERVLTQLESAEADRDEVAVRLRESEERERQERERTRNYVVGLVLLSGVVAIFLVGSFGGGSEVSVPVVVVWSVVVVVTISMLN